METEDQLIIQKTRLTEIFRQEKLIEIEGGLWVPEHFVSHTPISGTDYLLMGEVFEPTFIQNEIASHLGTIPDQTRERLGAIFYPIHKYRTIKNVGLHSQDEEKNTPSTTPPKSFQFMEQTKLKLIDPCGYKILTGAKDELASFQKLGIAIQLTDFLKEASKSITSERRRNLYRKFWDEQEKNTLHLLTRMYMKQVDEFGATKFMPFVPTIQHFSTIDNFSDQEAYLRQTELVNNEAHHVYNDKAVFNMELELSAIESDYVMKMVCRILKNAKNRIICPKLLKIDDFFSPRFGKHSTENLFEVLNVLKELKEKGKIVGLSSGGGFGYNLLGVCLNFYNDTVANYPFEGIPRASERKRALLHPITHALEPIGGVEYHLVEKGSLFNHNSIAKKYDGKSLRNFSKDEWSQDCRKMGLITHQQLVAGRVNSLLNKDYKALFLETMTSQYSKLAPLIRQLTA